jgi:hypothetical protein
MSEQIKPVCVDRIYPRHGAEIDRATLVGIVMNSW